MPDKNWQFELEEYIKQGEPDKAEKSESWQTAIGLQAVDGLNISEYLLDTAKDHIEGKITIDEAQKRIHSYYEQRTTRTETENETKEADIVSARITKLLGEKAFQFSPAEWLTIHRRLFEGVFDHAGQIRQYNITKKEWVLNGDTVIYADWNSIKETLDYDFVTEKQFSYEGLSVEAAVKHLAKFASDIWQIHPFGEGNTRATAVFMIKYMKTFGFRVNNDAFRENSWYFRNALLQTIIICKRAFIPPQSFWNCFSQISCLAQTTNSKTVICTLILRMKALSKVSIPKFQSVNLILWTVL
ncbi:Fic family protein [Ruminococcus intestinalis]|uniref:Fic family protein n=1 Tax=Ruminococcus intestinalis TaxID=2763066 RepID=UPI003F7CF230